MQSVPKLRMNAALLDMLGLLVLALLLLQSASQSEYTIQFGRAGDVIILGCRHSSGQLLQVNTTIRYWLNRTDSVRPRDDFEDDLQVRLGSGLILSNPPESDRPSATFPLTPDLEGRYTCGEKMSENSVIESDPILLASQLREGIRDNMAITRQSGEAVTLDCPYEVGRLSGCYFGGWLKNQTRVIDIGSPGPRCANVKDSMSEGAKYSIDRSTFSLTIRNLVATDSDVYTCDLSLVDPATPNGQTVRIPGTARPATNTLSVDVPALIIDGPNDTIVDMDSTTGELRTSSTFECIAVGLPAPTITWIYTASLTGEVQSLDDIAEISDEGPEVIQSGIYNGRNQVRSTLTLSIKPTDGGNVTCQAGSDRSDARLTVLSAPSSIELFRSCDGSELFYEINLPVPLNRLAALEFLYISSNNDITRMSTAMEFSGTDRIFYREDGSELRFSSYRIRIALSIATGNRLRQGPSFTSIQTINRNAISEGAIIGISAGVGAFIVGLVLFSCVLFIVGLYCTTKGYFKTARDAIRDIKALGKDVSEPEVFQNRINDLTEALDRIEKRLRLRPDGDSDLDTERELLRDAKRAKELAQALSAVSSSALTEQQTQQTSIDTKPTAEELETTV